MTSKIKIISYADLVESLLANLPEREREVLKRRNALPDFNESHTLEQIGRDFNITRERVRQIEKEGFKKLNALDYEKANLPINDLESLILDYLQAHGGFMAEDHLTEKLLAAKEEADEAKALNFILVNLLAKKFDRVNDLDDYHTIWKISNVKLDKALEIASALKNLVEDHGNPLSLEDLLEKFNSHEHYQAVVQMSGENTAVLEALLRLRCDIDKNILEQWGLNKWQTIKPKRMTDKAYLIMIREGKPLHFVRVADLINEADFDRKKAHPATVHNELILDDKYVLVGRGIYALKEWGYQNGTVAEIIADILKNKGPLNKNELLDEVLKQRLVQKTTVVLALMDKDQFAKLADGRYSLVK